MKKIITYSILALSIGATAQTLQRDVVASMGDTQTNGNVTLSYTVGQPISGVVGQSNKLSQGFQQNTVAYQDIELREGWGMASARVRPYDSDMIEVYSDVVAGLIIAKHIAISVIFFGFTFNSAFLIKGDSASVIPMLSPRCNISYVFISKSHLLKSIFLPSGNVIVGI